MIGHVLRLGGDQCRVDRPTTGRPAWPEPGACWAFVRAKLPQWIYGFYPIDQRWRVNTGLICWVPAALIPMLIPSAPHKRENVLFLLFVSRSPR